MGRRVGLNFTIMASPVEEIKEKLDIAELVGSYVKLEKAGQNFKALCPFHSEKTPSFYVTPARQIWHCFGCNQGGDVFRFVMNIEGIEFPEALRLLAQIAGVQLHREDPKARSEKTRLLDLLDDAAKFYEKNLVERKDVGAYLKERGMTGETAKSFRLGYAINSWEGLISYLRKVGYKPEEIEKAGLAVKSEKDEGYYDRFRARVMFPLFDSTGRAVGFSGRIFEKDLAQSGSQDQEPAKYINTPQTALYDKSRVLYGFERAKTEIRKKNSAVILEGQMDLIMSHQAGVANAVAVSGTALTVQHLIALKRLCDTLIMSFDMDSAGFEATKKSVDLALSAGFEIKVASIPSAKDPADLIKDNPKGWSEALDKAEPVISFLLKILAVKFPDSLAFKKEVSRIVLPYIASVGSEINRAHWVSASARAMQIREESVWQELEKLKSKKRVGNNAAKEQASDILPRHARTRRGLLEERLIGLAVWKKAELTAVLSECRPEWFSPERRPIFESSMTGVSEDHYFKKLALEAEVVYASCVDIVEEVKGLAKELKKEHLKETLVNLGESIKERERSGNKEDLQKKFEEFKLISSELNIL